MNKKFPGISKSEVGKFVAGRTNIFPELPFNYQICMSASILYIFLHASDYQRADTSRATVHLDSQHADASRAIVHLDSQRADTSRATVHLDSQHADTSRAIVHLESQRADATRAFCI